MNRTRIAPTPSGFLHVGNLLNFKLVQKCAAQFDAEIALRIDDVDSDRVREGYLIDIFEKLSAMQFGWQHGPKSYGEASTYSQSKKINDYREALSALQACSEDIFVCSCSRAQRIAGRCVADCFARQNKFVPDQNAVRIRQPNQDEVLWRRDDLPSYHLTDIVDDAELQITHVVRGADLFDSAQLQKVLRQRLQIKVPRYAFHPLIEIAGSKISKSTGTNKLLYTKEIDEKLEALADELLPHVNAQFSNPIESVFDLLPIDAGLLH
jgi:glutamyl-tRNA synthetase